MKKRQKTDKSLSQKITQLIVLIVACSTVIADIVANVSSELIHTSTMGSSGKTGAAAQTADSVSQAAVSVSQAAGSVSQMPLQQNNVVLWLTIIGVNVGFLAVFILITFLLGKRIARGISGPINRITAAADSIAAGNLNVDIRISSRDEIGMLAAAFQKIISSLNLLKTDVGMLVGEAAKGELDTRADISRHNGDYRVIIEGVNQTLDTIKAPLDAASGYLDKLADGEKQEKIENTYSGYYAVFIDNLNRVRESVNILENEASRLADAGQKGDLDVRGDESRLKGSYARIIHGVNQTFDSIKEPLDVASRFIGSLADGQILPPIENVYTGYYSALVDHLNDVRTSLQFLLDETSRLTQAGMRGDLTVRGDADALKGGYAEIVRGINQTLDSITVPIEEAKTVLARMAVNDYTASISGSYKGVLAELTGDINEVLQTLKRLQTLFLNVSKGDFSLYETYRAIGKRCGNDVLVPAAISMMQTIQELIAQSGRLADAALDGDLHVRGDADRFEGGYRQIIEGMNRTMEVVEAPIEESSRILQELAQGNLTAAMTGEYKGEYNKIKTALNQTAESFNGLLGGIRIASGQVAAGSRQVSDASQSLSQGAAEQASSVEELTSSITRIAAQTRQNAANATQASELSAAVETQAAQGNEKMAQMLRSMQEIDESSASISRIIKTIDDIAFQTNILALNAAVEAARAGQYGKGFAVVAEEVRNLAGKSAGAAKDTTALIEGSFSKVQAGTRTANETADMLRKIAQSARQSAALVSGIATASNEQATAIAQIDQGVTQVSNVVQTNSATAEESAASSEELSGQADMLMEAVAKFRLKSGPSGSPEKGAENPPAGRGEADLPRKRPRAAVSASAPFGKY